MLIVSDMTNHYSVQSTLKEDSCPVFEHVHDFYIMYGQVQCCWSATYNRPLAICGIYGLGWFEYGYIHFFLIHINLHDSVRKYRYFSIKTIQVPEKSTKILCTFTIYYKLWDKGSDKNLNVTRWERTSRTESIQI